MHPPTILCLFLPTAPPSPPPQAAAKSHDNDDGPWQRWRNECSRTNRFLSPSTHLVSPWPPSPDTYNVGTYTGHRAPSAFANGFNPTRAARDGLCSVCSSCGLLQLELPRSHAARKNNEK
ncbi:hypothetical protein BU24DRAFT_202855 [Aaosphaeria arxii CBS 175.79]|uniref:Uncharacterized protein n=1 Tax=Aaosphaeria arxii CBS 175.79 TaxID=1450172 RepID=A0A6A5XUK6_9PLEO|nr:uncharacterized protein BU24DRAFT_202855 [Aaosphaeria arxii CBS 175.79]KAF2016497.1 hypothetical protein BU24DRAFT_202855 [Aaosphaeria arxii CBS 175.79]